MSNEITPNSGQTTEAANVPQKFTAVRSLEIPLGTSITCMFKKNIKIETRVLGYDEDAFLLLKFPTLSGINQYLLKDTVFAALFKTSGYTVAFTSAIDIALTRQFLAFCAYPAHFKLYEIRGSKRVECLVPTAVDIDNQRYFGVIENVSSTGCRITFSGVHGTRLRKVEKDQALFIEAWTQNDTLPVDGVVVRAESSVSKVRLGVSFSTLNRQNVAVLEKFIHSLY